MEARAEDEDSERTKVATWRLLHERTATHAALNSSDKDQVAAVLVKLDSPLRCDMLVQPTVLLFTH